MYIVIAIIVFGILIASHELGHFFAAKACGVRVNEFSVGMGPAIFKKKRGETLYSLRCLPIGGFCAMEGEDEDSTDPRAFNAQSAWKRVIILVAGAATNFIIGFLVVLILFSNVTAVVQPVIAGFASGFPDNGEKGLMTGDRIIAVNGERVSYGNDFSLLMERDGDGIVDIILRRGGKRIKIDDYKLVMREYPDENGGSSLRYGINFTAVKANAMERMKYSAYTSFSFIRLVRFGLSDLLSGGLGLKDLSGPVGVVAAINDVGQSAESASSAAEGIAYFCAFIAINLAVMNMLPIPALDGGRVFFLVITWIIEKLSRKHVNPKYEGYINMAGLVLLLGLTAVVMVSDVVKIIHG